MEGFCRFIATVIRGRSDSNTLDDEPAKPLLCLTFLFVHTLDRTMFSSAALGTFTGRCLFLAGDRLRQGTLTILQWFEEGRGKPIVGCPRKRRKSALSRRLIQRIYSSSYTELVSLFVAITVTEEILCHKLRKKWRAETFLSCVCKFTPRTSQVLKSYCNLSHN